MGFPDVHQSADPQVVNGSQYSGGSADQKTGGTVNAGGGGGGFYGGGGAHDIGGSGGGGSSLVLTDYEENSFSLQPGNTGHGFVRIEKLSVTETWIISDDGTTEETYLRTSDPAKTIKGNTAVGDKSLSKIGTIGNAENNTCIGAQSGIEITTGSNNISIGFNSGKTTTTGSDNLYIGSSSGFNLIGNNNIAIGNNSGLLTGGGTTDGVLILDTNYYFSDDNDTHPSRKIRGSNSLMYAEQFPSGSSSSDTLSLNADVYINNLGGTSEGNLSVKGALKLTQKLSIDDNYGTVGQVLTSGGPDGPITWADSAGGNIIDGDFSVTGDTDLGSNLSLNSDYGTAGFVLTSGGSTGTISWTEPSGGLSLAGGSSNSQFVESNIYFGTGTGGTDGDHFDYKNARNLYIGHYVGSDITGSIQTDEGAGDDNVVIGYKSFKQYNGNTSDNIGIGSYTLGGMITNLASTSGSAWHNVAIGRESLSELTTGDNNICIGYKSGYEIDTGRYNTLIGRETGSGLSSGNKDRNVFLGYKAGKNINSSRNICIGDTSGLPSTYGSGNEGYLIIDSGAYYSTDSTTQGRGDESLIYAEQYDSTSASKDSLIINANVTIKDNTSSQNTSDGSLSVEGVFRNPGGLTTSGTSSTFTDGVFVMTDTSSEPRIYGWRATDNRVITTDSSGNPTALPFTDVCFLPGTKITLNNKILINIENIQKGDKLLSYKLNDMDPYYKSIDVLSWFSDNDNGEFIESEVEKLWSDKSKGYIIINNKLRITHEHLIFTFIDDEYTWLSAKNIRKGDIIFTHNGKYEEVTNIQKVNEEVKVYNLRVSSEAMNYFADSYLVHNSSLCDECAAKNNKI